MPFIDIQWNKKIKELVKFNSKPIFSSAEDQLKMYENDDILRPSELDIHSKYNLDKPHAKTKTAASGDLKPDLLPKTIIERIISHFMKPEVHANMKILSDVFEAPQETKYNIVVHFPIKFECLRIALGYKRKEFNKALAESHRWASSGGQTNSDFYKTDNGRFIAKCISSLEFEMFLQNALHYFKYVFSSVCSNKETFLSRVLSLVEIKVGKEEKKYLTIIEGITFGMKLNEFVRIYDLKGSKMNRFRKSNIRTKTNLDTNYLLERNGDPIVLQMPVGMDFFATLERDVNFLKDRDIVDYSLLLVLQKQDRVVRVGIIDYLRKYDLKKRIEHGLKKMRNFGQDPTIVNPTQYGDRFLQMMKTCIVAKHLVS